MTEISVFESLVPAIEQMYRSTIQIVDYYGSLAANSSALNSINYNSDEQSDLQQQIYDVDKDTLDTRQQMYDVDKNTSDIQQQIYNEANNIFDIYSNNATVAEKQGDLQQQIYDSDKNILDMGSDNTFVAEKQRGLQQQKYDVGSDTYGAIDDNTVIIQKQRVLAEDNFDIGADSFENRSGDVQAFEPYALDAFYGDMGLGTFGGMADEIAGVTGQVDALAYSFDNVAIGMQNIAATMLLVNSASGSLAGGLSLVVASPELLGGLSTVCNSIINIAAAMYATGGAAGYMATVTSLGYNEFKKYDTVSTTFSDVAGGIANVSNSVGDLLTNLGKAIEAFGQAAEAQENFSSVMSLSPYLGVAGSILKVVGSLVSLIGTIKAANEAANLAENSRADITTEASKYARENNVDFSTAQNIINRNQYYDELTSELNEKYEEIKKNKESAEASLKKLEPITNNPAGNYSQGNTQKYINETNVKLDRERDEKTIKLNEDIETYKKQMTDNYNARVDLEQARKADEQNYLDMYEQKQAANNNLNNQSSDINDYIKDLDLGSVLGLSYGSSGTVNVGTVDQVNKINGSVDIASEDLQYMRELAEQEAINQFTSKLIQPAINVTFGEVKETADVDSITKRITDGLIESLNNSSDVVHI